MRRLLLVVLCGVVLGVAAAPAMAGPTQGAYSGTGANQVSQVQSANEAKSPSGSSNSAGSTLPFTGLNVGLLGGVAITLLGSGLVLRRRTRSDIS